MLSYEEFKEKLKEEFTDYLPEDQKAEWKIVFSKQSKINKEVEKVSLLKNKPNVCPAINLDSLYERYEEIRIFSSVMYEFASYFIDFYEKGDTNFPEVTINEMMRTDNIIVQLINTEKNKELLKTVPSKQIFDLSIILRRVHDISRGRFATSMVKNEHLQFLDISEEELFEIAIENTGRLLSPEILSMCDIFMDYPEDMWLADPDFMEATKGQYVMTNKYRMHGAVSVLFENELHKLAEKVGCNLYLCPSSIHEFVIFPDMDEDMKNCIHNIVKEANQTSVSEDDFLSDSLYYYDREQREIRRICC